MPETSCSKCLRTLGRSRVTWLTSRGKPLLSQRQQQQQQPGIFRQSGTRTRNEASRLCLTFTRASSELTETLVAETETLGALTRTRTRRRRRREQGAGGERRERSGADYPEELKELFDPALNMETFRFPEVPSQTSGAREEVMSKKQLNVLVRQLAHSENNSLWPRAEKVVYWLESIDYPVDAWMYCEVLRSFRNQPGGEAKRALRLYRKVVSLRPKLRLTSHFYAEAMLALSKGTAEEARQALPIWNDLLRNGTKGRKGKSGKDRDTSALSKYALTAFLCACATSGEWKRAVRAFHSDFFLFQIATASSSSIEPKRREDLDLPDVVACTALMKCLRAPGQWKKGEELLQWMFENGINPNAYTYGSLIALLGETNQWEKVLLHFQELMTSSDNSSGSGMLPRPNIHIFSATVNALTAAGKYDLALGVLNQMMEERGIEPNAIFLVSLLSIYEKRREGRKALELFRYIQSKTTLMNQQQQQGEHGHDRPIQVNILVYNVLLSALSKSEAVDCVKEVFDEICALEKEVSQGEGESDAKQINHNDSGSSRNYNILRADRVTYETMISAYAHVADFKQADGMFREMCLKGFSPSDYAYAARIKAYAKKGLWRESVAILREVEEQGKLPPSVHVYNATLYACEITQKWELALKLYARMEEKGIEPNRVTKQLMAKICNSGIEIYEEKQRQTAALAAIGAAAGALAIRTGVF